MFLRPGSGEFKVNGLPFDSYFVTETQRIMAKSSFCADRDPGGSFNMLCTVNGGGVNGQAGAVRMGVARALQEFNPELRAKLKAEGFLRRDARGKERKKYGQKGARKRFQFSKRKLSVFDLSAKIGRQTKRQPQPSPGTTAFFFRGRDAKATKLKLKLFPTPSIQLGGKQGR